MNPRYTVVAVIDVPPEAVETFRRYEAGVLPLLARHGGRLERRLGTPEGTTEVHLVSFASEGDYRRYLDDPDRLSHRRVLTGVDLAQRVVESLVDVAGCRDRRPTG